MYNRYVPGQDGYRRVVVEEEPAAARNNRHRGTDGGARELFRNLSAPFDFLRGGESKNAGIAGILNGSILEDMDSGDVLLLLILLLVFLEGDNTELVITLGLMLLLGLGDQKE